MEVFNDYSWLGKKLTMCDRDELLKALQYYEVTLSCQRKANKYIIAEIKRLLVQKGL
jgi:predicted RNA-binding protein associated with RNAse of E/G family